MHSYFDPITLDENVRLVSTAKMRALKSQLFGFLSAHWCMTATNINAAQQSALPSCHVKKDKISVVLSYTRRKPNGLDFGISKVMVCNNSNFKG